MSEVHPSAVQPGHAACAEASPLGAATRYPSHYDPTLLFPIPRTEGRAALGLDAEVLPFTGHDRWQAYELGWLDTRGKPCVGTATLWVPADSPNLIESKSLKLYLNSFNAHRVESPEVLRQRIQADLSIAAGAPVRFAFGVPPFEVLSGEDEAASLDSLDIDIHHYGPPDATLLGCDADTQVEEALRSHLLKSNCPVTGQPDWATLDIRYRGPRIARDGLLRYIVSYRDHGDFHEQCVERIFRDVLAHCRPQWLEVGARYTRRGGLDINPWRATAGREAPQALRTVRQ